MIAQWWSWLLPVVGVAGLYLTTRDGNTRWAGYGVGLFVQFLWIAYAVATVQYGFILSALAYGAVNTIAIVKGVRQWVAKRKHEKRWRITGEKGWDGDHYIWWVEQPNNPDPVRAKYRFFNWHSAVRFIERSSR